MFPIRFLLTDSHQLAVATAAGLLATSLAAGAASSIIDDFDDGDMVVSAGLGFGAIGSDAVPASVAGGTRALQVEVTGELTGNTHAIIDPDSTDDFIRGVLDVANNTPSSVVTLGYDADGAGLSGDAGDFGSFNAIEVVFDYLQLDFGTLDTKVRVTDQVGGAGELSLTLSSDIGSPTVGDDTAFSFPFSSFNVTAGAQIDFSQLSSIEVIFDTGADSNVDYRVEAVRAVPEASTAGLCLLGAGIALVALRKRRNP